MPVPLPPPAGLPPDRTTGCYLGIRRADLPVPGALLASSWRHGAGRRRRTHLWLRADSRRVMARRYVIFLWDPADTDTESVVRRHLERLEGEGAWRRVFAE